MRLLAFYLGLHDSNICTYDTDLNAFRYYKTERLTGIKRHRADLSFVIDVCNKYSFKPDYIAVSDGDRNALGSCAENQVTRELPPLNVNIFKDARIFHVDHHLAHTLSVWPIMPTHKLQWGIAIDGRGDNERRISVFRDPSKMQLPVFSTTDYRVCHLFDLIGTKMGLSGHVDDFAGKIMGAQAYGCKDDDYIDEMLSSSVELDVFRLANDINTLRWNANSGDNFFDFKNAGFRNWLASTHAIVGELVLRTFRNHFKEHDVVAYAGGCALNTVINQQIKKEFKNVIIPPHCYDGGLSLGCIEALRLILKLPVITVTDFPFIQQDEDFGYASLSTISHASELLAQGKCVGWIQGHGEIGPRALGHRSLLINPAISDGKDKINKIKQREYWRPFAPSVLHSKQNNFFTDNDYMPYMLYTTECTKHSKNSIPAVVHVDGTSRIQSVDCSSCSSLESYSQLIEHFEFLTGIPLLLNSSYNPGGKPIVSTRGEALAYFESTAMDGLVLGDELFIK